MSVAHDFPSQIDARSGRVRTFLRKLAAFLTAVTIGVMVLQAVDVSAGQGEQAVLTAMDAVAEDARPATAAPKTVRIIEIHKISEDQLRYAR
jgi:hypothetical protein